MNALLAFQSYANGYAGGDRSELLITLVVVVCVCVFLYWLAGKLPEAMRTIGQIVAVAIGCLWFLFHLRDIIHSVVNG